MRENHPEPGPTDTGPAGAGPANTGVANASPTERRIRRLVVPEPSGFARSERIDFLHEPDTEPLWGPA